MSPLDVSRRRRGVASAALAAALLTTPAPAAAQVAPTESASATVLTLPDGPGSVSGLARAAELDVFSGQVQYSVPIRTPGAGGQSPSVALSYSGALGNGPLGIGWALASPAIRRSLRDGVPRYDDTDELTIEGVGGGRLVRISDDEYRVEGAGNSVRVRRVRQYFEVTDGDGTRYVFGHSADARLQSGERIAGWLLETVVDLTGAAIDFEYQRDRGQVYLRRVQWGPGKRYRLEIDLEARQDVVTSLATGFEVTTALRVDRIAARVALPGADAVELSRYQLTYDDEATGDIGSVSRLVRITMTGRRDASGQLVPDSAMPPLSFGYAAPDRPRQWELDAGGWVVDQRGVALVDVDGDGADDLLRLEPGATAWRRNLGGHFGPIRLFDGAAALSLTDVRFLDLDGDARAEVIRVVDDTWRVYRIERTGDRFGLSAGRTVAGTRSVPLTGASTVLADVDGDGDTDVLDAVTDGLRLRKSSPTGLGPDIYLPPIAAGTPSVEPGGSGLRFLDANGDGLADAVWLTDSWLKVYLGRGDGTFQAFAKVFYPWGTTAIAPDLIHLVDLDRDGVVDLLRVDAGKLRWFRGLAGFRFDQVPRQLPRPAGSDADARVSFTDVDGNGSEEVVWASLTSMVALDLAGGTTRGMITSIDDGMGEVQSITYSTSTQLSLEAEAAGSPWARLLPRSMAVPVRQETRYADGTPARGVAVGVRDGFWDGVERRFGGFLVGRSVLPGASAAEVRVDQTRYHEGAGHERVLRGRPVEQRTEDGRGALYTVTTSSWDALRPQSLDRVRDPADPLLRRAALRRHEVQHHEGVTTPLTTLREISYDAEVRPFEERNHGRLDLDGDEQVTWRRFASDETLWVRDRVVEDKVTTGAGALVAHTRHYFGNHHGDPLPLGTIGFGWPRRTDGLLWSEGSQPIPPRWVTVSQLGYDAHGNVIESTLGPTGVAGTRRIGYDADGLFAERETIEPEPGRTLVWIAAWDPVLGVQHSVTEPSGDVTRLSHDGLGRVTAIARNALPPHQRYAYEWTAPRPRTWSYVFDGETRDLAAAADDWSRTDRYRSWRHTVTVADSAGDELYTAGRLGADRWLISGWKLRDQRGRVAEVLEGFEHTGALPSAPPTTPLRRQTLGYDALDRPVAHQLPTGARTLASFRAFEESVQASDLAPVTARKDGLGRIIHSERVIDGVVETVDARYDAAGRVLALELQRPQGASGPPACSGSPWVAHCFTYDSFGRMVEADDPDAGLRVFSYDDAGYLTRHVNGAGQAIGLTYDRVGRLIERRGDDGTVIEYHHDVGPRGENRAGKLAWVKEPTGRVEIDYDPFGRAGNVVRAIGASRMSHDTVRAPSGALLSERYVRDWKVSWLRDMAGRVTKVTGTHGTLWEATSFDGASRLTGERFGNGVVGAYTYDGNGQTEHVSIRRSAAGPLLYDVDLDRNGYGAVTRAVDGDRAGLDHSAGFTYDPAGRLTHAVIGAGDRPFAFDYRFDGLQNMVSRQAQTPRALGQHLGIHCYGQNGAGPRQLTSIIAGTPPQSGTSPCDVAGAPTVARFTYDDAGRQRTDGDARLAYDDLDQLVAVDLPDGNRVEYAYGYEGLRIRTSDSTGAAPEHWFTADLREVGGLVEQYVKVDGRVIARVQLSSGEPAPATAVLATSRTVGLAFLGGLVALLAGVGAIASGRRRTLRPALACLLIVATLLPGCGALFGDAEQALWRPTKITYLHTGFAPGPVLMTGETGAVVDERRFEPYGQAIDSFREPTGVLDTIDYALEPLNILGKPTDPRTGWSYHGARWMAPQTARWLSPDPQTKAPDPSFMVAPWKMHPYQYVDQNPILYWDPDGHQAWYEDLYDGAAELASDAGDVASDVGEFVVDEVVPRAVGAAQVAGGAVMFAGGAALCETGVGCVIGAAGMVYGADVAAAGVKQTITGKPERTVTNQAIAKVADQRTADNFELGVNLLTLGVSTYRMAVATYGRTGTVVTTGQAAAKMGKGLCFTEGTPVLTAHGAVAIEQLRVGDRVLADGDSTEVDGTWRTVVLEMPNPDGSGDRIDITLLRPAAWLDDRGVAADAWIPFSLPEMGIVGPAYVVSVAPPPEIVDGAGRVVLATVSHVNDEVYQLHLRGHDQPLQPTRSHRLYSADRRAWVPTGELRVGERLRTRTGTARIEAIRRLDGGHRVHNIEVETEHTYLVGAAEVLSHNNNPCAPINVSEITSNPTQLWGRSAQEVADAFNNAGFKATVRQSTRGSKQAVIVEIKGNKQVSQIQVHPGGGRHGGAYVKISTNDGKIKVIDPATYVPTPGERVTLVPYGPPPPGP